MEPTAIAVIAGFFIDHLPPQVKANIVDAVTSAITGAVGPMTAPLRAWFDGQARITAAKADAQVAIISGLSEAAAVAAASDPEIVSRALTQFGGRLVREQENREAIVGETAKLLRATPPKVDAGSSIDEDWLYTFWRLAETKSNRDIQVIFGSILAGEVANPGTFSPGTLALLATLTPDVAQRFARFARLTMLGEGDASVIHPNVFSFQNIGPLDAFGVTYDDLFELQGAQLIRSAETLMVNYAADAQPYEVDYAGVRAMVKPAGQQWHLLQLTRAGRDLRRVIALSPNKAYTAALVQKLGEAFELL